MVEIEGLAKKHHSSCYIKPNVVLRYVLIDRGEMKDLLARKLTLSSFLYVRKKKQRFSLAALTFNVSPPFFVFSVTNDIITVRDSHKAGQTAIFERANPEPLCNRQSWF